MATKPTEDEVLTILRDGGSVRYFYLQGGVAVHGKEGNPSKDVAYCPIEIFLKWQGDGTIVMVRDNPPRFPWYADNAKSQEYKLRAS